MSLAHMAARLSDERDRLDELAIGGREVRDGALRAAESALSATG